MAENVSTWKTFLNNLTSLSDKSLSEIVSQAASGVGSFSSEKMTAIRKLIGENPGTAVSAAALVGISLTTYLHIRTKGTEEENVALNRQIRKERRKTEETSDKRVERRRTNKIRHLSESLGSSVNESMNESMSERRSSSKHSGRRSHRHSGRHSRRHSGSRSRSRSR